MDVLSRFAKKGESLHHKGGKELEKKSGSEEIRLTLWFVKIWIRGKQTRLQIGNKAKSHPLRW